jgi:hypothetical protein
MRELTEPTPEEIRKACLDLQAGWNLAEERRRRGGDPHECVEVKRGRIGDGVREPRD